jgi:hypothetical protein
VDNSLRPRLTFLAGELGEEAAMQTVTANPRLLLSSYGTLGRLTFVRETTGGEGPNAVSPSTALMAPKATFAERFPAYRGWLLGRLGQAEAKRGKQNADVGALEKAHGLLLEERFQSACHPEDAIALPEANVARHLFDAS